MTTHRAPDVLTKHMASWTVPTTGEGADSRVVACDQVSHWNGIRTGPFAIMIRAERLPATDAPALIEAVAAAAAWIAEREPVAT